MIASRAALHRGDVDVAYYIIVIYYIGYYIIMLIRADGLHAALDGGDVDVANY